VGDGSQPQNARGRVSRLEKQSHTTNYNRVPGSEGPGLRPAALPTNGANCAEPEELLLVPISLDRFSPAISLSATAIIQCWWNRSSNVQFSCYYHFRRPAGSRHNRQIYRAGSKTPGTIRAGVYLLVLGQTNFVLHHGATVSRVSILVSDLSVNASRTRLTPFTGASFGQARRSARSVWRVDRVLTKFLHLPGIAASCTWPCHLRNLFH
jgi:hypothetical protein